MEGINIRKVLLSNIDSLVDISIKTFAETFSLSNKEEDMQKYIDENLSKDKLFAELSNSNSQFYFATINNDVVGYIKLNSGQAQTELKSEKDSLEIERIYVLQGYQGMSIGRLLFQKVISVANMEHISYIWLGVWEQNLKAISFYRKNGFTPFSKHIFKLGSDEQIDIMMKLMLNKN